MCSESWVASIHCTINGMLPRLNNVNYDRHNVYVFSTRVASMCRSLEDVFNLLKCFLVTHRKREHRTR